MAGLRGTSNPMAGLSLAQIRALWGPPGRVGERSWSVLVRRGILTASPWRCGGLLRALTSSGMALVRDGLPRTDGHDIPVLSDEATLLAHLASPGSQIRVVEKGAFLTNGSGRVTAVVEPFLFWCLELGGLSPGLILPAESGMLRQYRLGPYGETRLRDEAMRRDAETFAIFDDGLARAWGRISHSLRSDWRACSLPDFEDSIRAAFSIAERADPCFRAVMIMIEAERDGAVALAPASDFADNAKNKSGHDLLRRRQVPGGSDDAKNGI